MVDARLSRVTQLPHPTGSTARSGNSWQQPALRRRLAALRGPGRPARPLDSRALAALAANPGCARRALLDSAGVDKAALAQALGAPTGFGQSQFAFARGHAFESRALADGGLEIVRLLCAATGQQPPEAELLYTPDTLPPSDGDEDGDEDGAQGSGADQSPAARHVRTLRALADASAHAASGGWAVLLHPMLELTAAGATVYLEPDALVFAPGGDQTLVEIKSFPILDGSADPTKVGAAARQCAVYALALAEATSAWAEPREERLTESALLVCPKDFSNIPTAALVDLRKQIATAGRQLRRLTRVEEIAAALPEGLSFDPDQSPDRLQAAVAAVPATYAPDCLAGCDLAFHCRGRARATGEPALLGRGVRAELGGLATIDAALAAARGQPSPTDDPAVEALRRAARLRSEALAEAGRADEQGGHPCH